MCAGRASSPAVKFPPAGHTFFTAWTRPTRAPTVIHGRELAAPHHIGPPPVCRRAHRAITRASPLSTFPRHRWTQALVPPRTVCSRASVLQPSAPITGVVLLEEAARAAPPGLMTRLAEALNVALGSRILPETDAIGPKRALREAVNAWALSVSRFLEVQDEMRVILNERARDAWKSIG